MGSCPSKGFFFVLLTAPLAAVSSIQFRTAQATEGAGGKGLLRTTERKIEEEICFD